MYGNVWYIYVDALATSFKIQTSAKPYTDDHQISHMLLMEVFHARVMRVLDFTKKAKDR